MIIDIDELVARLRLRARELLATTPTLPELDKESGNLHREAAAALEEMQAERDCLIIDYQNEHARAERAEAEREELRRAFAARVKHEDAIKHRLETECDALRADAERLRKLLNESFHTLNHGRVFITSREKMHPDGVELWDRIAAAIDAARKGKPE